MTSQFKVVVVGERDRRIVIAHGQLFAAAGQLLQDLVADFVRDCAHRVRLDLRDVTAADLDGLHAVSSMRDALSAAGANLMITNPTRPVYDVFRLFSDLIPGPRPTAGPGTPLPAWRAVAVPIGASPSSRPAPRKPRKPPSTWPL
jgi:anti-anti-sigma regulatory factor